MNIPFLISVGIILLVLICSQGEKIQYTDFESWLEEQEEERQEDKDRADMISDMRGE